MTATVILFATVQLFSPISKGTYAAWVPFLLLKYFPERAKAVFKILLLLACIQIAVYTPTPSLCISLVVLAPLVGAAK
jgi:hypothetical protein